MVSNLGSRGTSPTSRSRISDSEANDSLRPWWSHSVIKRRPFWLPGAGLMVPATFPLCLGNLWVWALAPFLIIPSLRWPWVITSCKHTIASVTKGDLNPNYLSAHNSPRASMCPFFKTVVWIAARPQLFKVRAYLIPAMLWDHRSHDLYGASELMAQIYPFQSCGSNLTYFKSMVVICFRILDFGILKSQTFLSIVHQSSGVDDL